MKRGIFVTIIFFILILIFFSIYYYIFQKNGNNIIIKDVNQAESYISNIGNYRATVEVTVESNKNSNIYNMKQVKENDYRLQEGIDGEIEGIIIENKEGKVIIKNTKLNLTKIYNDYSYMTDNCLFLDTFIKEWKESEDKKVIEEENNYKFEMKIKNQRNRYIQSKTLYLDKNTNEPASLEIKDVNRKRTIYILYKEIEIER